MNEFTYKADRDKPSPTKLLIEKRQRERRERLYRLYLHDHSETPRRYWLRALNLAGDEGFGPEEALAFGETKYAPKSWRLAPQGLPRFIDAAFRHLCWELFYPEDVDGLDKESGLPHLSHAAASIFIVLDLLGGGGDTVRSFTSFHVHPYYEHLAKVLCVDCHRVTDGVEIQMYGGKFLRTFTLPERCLPCDLRRQDVLEQGEQGGSPDASEADTP